MTAIIQHQFNMVAREYGANRRKFIPCFDDFYKSATDFIAHSIDTEPNLIYDLGSGTGLLPSFWFRHFPKARYVLIDIADEMLNVARRRFTDMANVLFVAKIDTQFVDVGCHGSSGDGGTV